MPLARWGSRSTAAWSTNQPITMSTPPRAAAPNRPRATATRRSSSVISSRSRSFWKEVRAACTSWAMPAPMPAVPAAPASQGPNGRSSSVATAPGSVLSLVPAWRPDTSWTQKSSSAE
jgi:hypothetical protein